jgi:hypothetical protein
MKGRSLQVPSHDPSAYREGLLRGFDSPPPGGPAPNAALDRTASSLRSSLAMATAAGESERSQARVGRIDRSVVRSACARRCDRPKQPGSNLSAQCEPVCLESPTREWSTLPVASVSSDRSRLSRRSAVDFPGAEDTRRKRNRYLAGAPAPARGRGRGLSSPVAQAHRGQPRGMNRGSPGVGRSGTGSGPGRWECTRARLHQTHTLK